MSIRHRFLRIYAAWATPAYLGSLLLATCIFLAVPIYFGALTGLRIPALAAFALLALIPASDMAMAVVNRMVTDSLGPKTLPKLDFPVGSSRFA